MYGTLIEPAYKLDKLGSQAKRGFFACTRGRPIDWGTFGGAAWYNRDHIGYWHTARTNVGYLDGHVETLGYGDMDPNGNGVFFLPWAN